MKTLSQLTLVTLILFQVPRASAQGVAGSPLHSSASVAEEHKLTKFDLNFSGGTPRELVAAIQKAMGRQLNAVIPDQYAELKLPPLEMKGIDVQQLFSAMYLASHSQTATLSGGNYLSSTIEFGFRNVGGPITDDTVWFFTAQLPADDRELCRFYLLTPYIQAGLTVDDITTAIQTSWKMLGVVRPPKLSFHKETSLLIAVGTMSNLDVINAALYALGVQPKITPQPAK